MNDFSLIAEQIRKEHCAPNSLQNYRSIGHKDFWLIVRALNTPDVNRFYGWDVFLLNMVSPCPRSIRELRRMLIAEAKIDEFFDPALTCIDVLLQTPILNNITWDAFLKKLKYVNHQPTFDCLHQIQEKNE